MNLESKRFGGDHAAQHSENVLIDSFFNSFANVSFWINFTSVLDGKLFFLFLCLFFNSLCPFFSPFCDSLEIVS